MYVFSLTILPMTINRTLEFVFILMEFVYNQRTVKSVRSDSKYSTITHRVPGPFSPGCWAGSIFHAIVPRQIEMLEIDYRFAQKSSAGSAPLIPWADLIPTCP